MRSDHAGNPIHLCHCNPSSSGSRKLTRGKVCTRQSDGFCHNNPSPTSNVSCIARLFRLMAQTTTNITFEARLFCIGKRTTKHVNTFQISWNKIQDITYWSLLFIQLVAPKRAFFLLGPAINTLQDFYSFFFVCFLFFCFSWIQLLACQMLACSRLLERLAKERARGRKRRGWGRGKEGKKKCLRWGFT